VQKAPALGLFAERRLSPRPRTRDFGETAVRSIGVGLAVASTAFAAYMISDTERQPQFAGLEHLSIYSRPATLASRRAQTQLAEQSPKVDYTPTASIREAQPPRAAGFQLIEVRDGTALIQTPNARVRVIRGDVIAGLGRVTALERRGEQWVVVTTGGLVSGN
jgi:hypothetical protein